MCDKGLEPDEFVEDMKKKGVRVAGIGHRIKSKVNLCGFPLLAMRRPLMTAELPLERGSRSAQMGMLEKVAGAISAQVCMMDFAEHSGTPSAELHGQMHSLDLRTSVYLFTVLYSPHTEAVVPSEPGFHY